MPIADNVAAPIAKYASKAFINRFDPNKPTLQRIFHENWKPFLDALKTVNITFPQYVFDEVERMIACGTLDMGFEVYECPNCHRHHIICYTCKSRFCTSCGTKTTKARALKIAKSTLDVQHRHMVFTIDERLRKYFYYHKDWLNFLFDAASEAIIYTFNKQKKESQKSNQRKRKRRKKKKKSSLTPGFICTLHSYGRDLKWNPHLHLICTEGGMDENHVYRAVSYINYESLRKSFMRQLLYKMRDALPPDSQELKEFKKLISQLYREKTNGFYVFAPPMKTSKSGKDQVIKYMIRYAGKPVMAQSRITGYDYYSKTVTYWYQDHKTNETITVNESVYKFILKLIRHIMPPQFKMVRYYGIYATCDHKHKKPMKRRLSKQNHHKFNHDRPKHYRLSLIDTFGTDPLLCTCGHYMEFVDAYVPSRFHDDGESP